MLVDTFGDGLLLFMFTTLLLDLLLIGIFEKATLDGCILGALNEPLYDWCCYSKVACLALLFRWCMIDTVIEM